VSEYLDVVEQNPLVFVKAISKAIAEGYQVSNTLEGYPEFGSYINRVRLFKGIKEAPQDSPEADGILIEQYDPMVFLLEVEKAAAAGYKYKIDGSFHNEVGLHGAEFVKPEKTQKPVKEVEVKEKAEPKKAAKKPAAKKLEAEPTKDELEGDE